MNNFITLGDKIVNIRFILTIQESPTIITMLNGTTIEVNETIEEIKTLSEISMNRDFDRDKIIAFKYRIGQEILAEKDNNDDYRLYNGYDCFSNDINDVIDVLEQNLSMNIIDLIKDYRWN